MRLRQELPSITQERGDHRGDQRADIAASVPDPGVFKSGRDFAAWLGLTSKQNSSGGKAKLGAITKQGNRYIRKMLVVGCTSALRVAGKRKGAFADWIAALRARKPERLVAVALANKLARICWAIMTTGEEPTSQSHDMINPPSTLIVCPVM